MHIKLSFLALFFFVQVVLRGSLTGHNMSSDLRKIKCTTKKSPFWWIFWPNVSSILAKTHIFTEVDLSKKVCLNWNFDRQFLTDYVYKNIFWWNLVEIYYDRKDQFWWFFCGKNFVKIFVPCYMCKGIRIFWQMILMESVTILVTIPMANFKSFQNFA